MAAGLILTPPDYLQGETVRIMYIHVPSAWLGMAGWLGIAAASISQLVWRHPLAAIAGRAVAPAGATFAAICLITGSIWGRPTWGTWWEWDGRLTSMLVLFFLYLGYIALASAERERGGEGRIAAIYGIVGAVNLPIIHYSVLWWRTLHQGESIGLTGSTIDNSMLWPLPLTMVGFTCLFAAAVLMRMRAELAEAKVEARMRRRAQRMNPLALRDCRLRRRDRPDGRAAPVGVRLDAPGRSGGRRAQAKMKPKNQRLVLVLAAIAALFAAALLAMWGLRSQASYFYTPADIAAGKAHDGEAMRLGGMVERGSIKRLPDGVTIRFVVTDGKARTPVIFRGIVPDLFREGSGAVAEGRLANGTFVADTILAKHDERYMPPELGNLTAEHKAGKTLEK